MAALQANGPAASPTPQPEQTEEERLLVLDGTPFNVVRFDNNGRPAWRIAAPHDHPLNSVITGTPQDALDHLGATYRLHSDKVRQHQQVVDQTVGKLKLVSQLQTLINIQTPSPGPEGGASDAPPDVDAPPSST